MRDAVKEKAEILLVLGYTTASVFFPLMNFRNSVLITNMDGLEWKRDKWNSLVKKLAKWFERLGARHSHYLVSDNEKIREYLLNTYGRDSSFIAYGCEPFTDPDVEVLSRYDVEKCAYGILVARMEAENNIDMILDGFTASKETGKLLVVGNLVTAYATRMVEKYGSDQRIVFKGGIYDQNHLNNLRHFARFYFHGHSVGGTNPSLLEAMASGSFIIAHGNEFNKAILGDDALYFKDASGLSEVINQFSAYKNRDQSVKNNLDKVIHTYNWNSICNQYEDLFNKVLQK